ncbi:MAG: hypothetical protein AB1540_09380 [Bdellovibrionota bacterium]
MRMLLIAISLLVSSHAYAMIGVGPSLTFESFRRTVPEEISTWRLAYGIAFTTELSELFAVDIGAAISHSEDTFSSGNSLDERTFWGQLGGLIKLYRRDSLYVGPKVGFHYLYVNETYRTISNQEQLSSDATFWRPYLGIEGAVVPLSGFGVRESILFLYDKRQRRWALQIMFGIVI